MFTWVDWIIAIGVLVTLSVLRTILEDLVDRLPEPETRKRR